jgi:ribosome-binding ATPase YchF (GTP1/OBG family)
MKIGVTGLPGSGKSTVFSAITHVARTTETADVTKPHLGAVKVPDPRLDELGKIFGSKKVTPIELTFVDNPGFKVAQLGDAGALVHVIGAFFRENPVGDIEEVAASFIVRDAEVIQHRLPEMEKEIRGGKSDDVKEFEALKKCQEALAKDAPLRTASLSGEEKKLLRGYQFLSLKPVLFVSNIAETAIETGSPKALRDYIAKNKLTMIEFCGKTELDILEVPEGEREGFLKEMGIDVTARDKFIKAAFELLEVISFFTVKGPEARAWMIPADTPAIEAAGKIHTDMKKGFIRAEVVSYDDLMKCGGKIAEARTKGLLRVEGKDYIVKDGEILDIRFNV